MNMFKSIAEMFVLNAPKVLIEQDPSLYEIETAMKKYCGKIIYQDDVVIKFRLVNLKPVKILKANINRIEIIVRAAA